MINWSAIRQKDLRFLVLDLTMTSVAILNLLLITFDLTYFTLRDFYVHRLPGIAQRYDLLKGVEPHRFTTGYVAKAEAYFRAYPALGPAERQARQSELIALSAEMIEDDPFQRADKSGDLELIKEVVRDFTGVTNSSKQAFRAFWQFPEHQYLDRVAFFRGQIEPLMATNYWRRIDTSGRPVDLFFYVDLVFVIIFLSEFAIMWGLAIRRFGPDQRILYPLFRWYDLVGCLPLPGLRFLRLFRVFAIYRRLLRSDILTLGDSPIIRLVKRYQDIILEEISDQVSINILTGIQDKVRLGSGRDVLERTLLPHKHQITQTTLASIQKIERRILQERKPEWVAFISSVIDDSLKGSPELAQLARIPLVNRKVAELTSRPSIEAMVTGTLDRTVDALETALQSEQGQAFVQSIIDDLLDELVQLSRDELYQELVQTINLQLLDELKKGNVTVKKWKAGRTPLPGKPAPSDGGANATAPGS